ncbi:hypothetical protein Dtox_1236 [Desulfofarcimen acetoxidans DSM 771]|jgi:hypothetical protein|uniref:Uncharacterized protein n=1 Tax=Desulfofarcimen acetoxidans (strain ATCC 49208 / DSM 771 / KCTC 5769 / VKM B-1644 / 5575) TaxID=485916 RepID=C8W5D8_DESAS|nr:hypothetical protein Dtox_1236 [Desulfofarcimen acetoxidans DSM 771]
MVSAAEEARERAKDSVVIMQAATTKLTIQVQVTKIFSQEALKL